MLSVTDASAGAPRVFWNCREPAQRGHPTVNFLQCTAAKLTGGFTSFNNWHQLRTLSGFLAYTTHDCSCCHSDKLNL